LIVGTLGGGGIHHYVDEQAERLSDDFSVRVYDMATESPGSGLVWVLTSLLRSVVAAIRFPFQRAPDVVHVHTSHRFSFYRASFYVLFAAYVWRRPVILHIHGSSFDEFARADSAAVRRLQSVVFAASERIIVLSEFWRDVLESRVSPEKLQMLPNAVDPDEYDPGFGDDPLHVVFVSNLIERKGVPELIEAVDALDSSTEAFRVTVAGKGPLSDSVEELASRHEHVTYRGYVSEEEKRRLLASGSVFVLPTHAEGLPIAMLEGMAGENAIVSTSVGSIPEVIGEDNGILIEPGDADGLAGALEELFTSPERIEQMARRNRDLIEEKYSWSEATDQLEQAYAAERGEV
jgi:glycosyltransferase involved in cell wall biosynthesis